MVFSVVVLVIKVLKELEWDRKKVKNIKYNGNILFDDVIEIVKVMVFRFMVKSLVGIVKEIFGICVFVGCIVDGKDFKDF